MTPEDEKRSVWLWVRANAEVRAWLQTFTGEELGELLARVKRQEEAEGRKGGSIPPSAPPPRSDPPPGPAPASTGTANAGGGPVSLPLAVLRSLASGGRLRLNPPRPAHLRLPDGALIPVPPHVLRDLQDGGLVDEAGHLTEAGRLVAVD